MSPQKKETNSRNSSEVSQPGGEYKLKPILISKDTVKHASEGCIVWLPAKEDIGPGSHVDERLHAGAFDHPAIIISCPTLPKLNSLVEIAIMTSGANRTLHETKALSHFTQLLRVRTMAYPYAKVDLTLKGAKGMRRKYSWVSLKTYEIELGTLSLYERQLGEYCLTRGSLSKLRAGIANAKVKREGKGKKAKGTRAAGKKKK